VNHFLLALLALASSPTAAEVAADQEEVVDYMLAGTPAGGTTVIWAPCGMQNAWYYTGGGPIVLCLEMADTTAAVFVAAHEAGHALVDQLGMDPGWDSMAGERAADELAALFLAEMGRYDDIVGGAKWFLERWDTESRDGVHPARSQRARDLLCLADGAETAREGRNGSLECLIHYKVTWTRWSIALDAALKAAE
jgi:hypothetical protein